MRLDFSYFNENMFTPGGTLTIGEWKYPQKDGDTFAGIEMWIDEVKVWKGIKTRKELTQNIGKVFEPDEPNLSNFWRFSEGMKVGFY